MRKMKKRSLLSLMMTAAMVLGLLSPVQAFADTNDGNDNMTELSLPNGDFETGNAENWILFGYNEVKSDDYASNNTTNMLNLWLSNDEAAKGSASYSVELTEGTYYFTFDLSGADADSGLKYSVTAGDSVLAEGDDTYKTTGWDVWKTYATEKFTLTENTDVTFTLSGTQAAGYWGWLDNLKLYGTGSVSNSDSNPVDPEPANPEPTDPEPVDPNPVDPDPVNPDSSNSEKDYGMALGSDISAAADTDKTYTNKDGETKKLYDICKDDYGMNMVRLRTWVNHSRGSCSEDSIIAYAKKCDEAGLRVMVDFHYADNWADPGKQPPPSAWNVTDNISFEEAQRVGEELYDYTYNFLTHMIAEGVTPEWVQVGNEITNGMIWPLCNIANYENFTYVLQRGIDAVRAASPDTKVVIHIDNGASTETVISWFERLVEAGVTDFDVMGLSFYPSDHDPTSSIESLANTFEGLYNEFCVGTDREIMVVEIGANYLSNATTNQKYNMIVNVINELKAIPDGRGTGCIYWEIENYEMEGGRNNSKPNKVWEAFSPNAQLVNENPVIAISLAEGEALELEINDVHQLQVNVEPEQPDITRMVYTSSDPEVCTVSGGGQIKALGIGESTITVSNYAGTNGEYETFTQTLKVTVTEEKPGLKNGGFELGDNGIWKYSSDNVGAGTLGTSANSLSGSCSLHFTGGAGDVDFTFYQDINGLAPGKYRLTGHVMGDNGITTLNLFANTTDKEYTSEDYKTIDWGGAEKFVEMVLEDIEVLDGTLRVGAHAAATYTGKESWGDFDDFTLELVEAYDVPVEKDYGMALGSDISAAADTDKTYTNKDGETKKLYGICKDDYGMNMVRLRTWIDHKRGSCSEDSIIAYAKKCDEAGLRVMVDFHYADNWADPGKQPAPSAWNVTDDISFEEAQRVGEELYNYTYNFLTHMIAEGVTPEWVQVGNEITNGMIWPLCNTANYENFTYVLQRGIDAVRDASPDTKVVIHIDNGASTETVISWFERLVEAGVTDFDVMGLSFYPSDHDPTSSIESLANTFEGLYNEFCIGTDREIMVVEIGANYLSNATENQKYNMIVNVVNELKAIPDGRGTGCVYWEIENYEMNTTRLEDGTRISKPNRVWEAFSPNAQLVNDNPVTAISLAEGEALELEINDVHQLQVNVEPEQPDITRMVYTSSDPEVCTVSGGGQIKALGIGESTITVSNYAGTDESYEVFTQTLKVTVTEEKPGLKNGGFELGDNGIWKYDPDNVGTPTLGTSANSLSGSCSLHFTGGSGDVEFTFYQDINGLAPGKYRLTGYVMGDTGVTTLNLFAQTTDEEFTSELYKTIGWGGSDSFVKMTLEDIEVLDGKLRVGAHAAATYTGSESWGDFDDFTLELVEAYDIPEEPDSEARIALQNLYDLSKDLEQGSYTDTSYQAFKEALTAAADILANEDATDAELTAAYDLLSETIGGLVEAEKPGEPENPDKPGKTDSEARTALQNLYNASKDLAQGKYTNNSYAAFTKALKAAETVLSDEDATDAELTAAYNALTDAIAGLKTDASAAKPSSSTAVKTGDTAPVAMYVLFVLIAFGIVLSTLAARRRYRR